jgi:hypothetical protein
MFWLAGIQDAIFLAREMLDAVTRRAQIVHQDYFTQIQFACQYSGIHGPRQIRGTYLIIDDGASHAKACGAYAFSGQVRRGLQREFPNDQVKLRKVFACKTLLEDGSELAGLFREQRKIAFRTANVTRKNHRFPPLRCCSLSIAWLNITD